MRPRFLSTGWRSKPSTAAWRFIRCRGFRGSRWSKMFRTTPVDWLDAFSNDDGPATLLRTATVDLVRVEPKVALPHFQATANKAVTRADFTLPFGVMAHLATDPQTDPRQLPRFQLNDAHYKGDLSNALQLSIIANPNSDIQTKAGGS